MPAGSRLFLLTSVFCAVAAGETQLPEGDGRRLIETFCLRCHESKELVSKRLSREQWQRVVSSMTNRGASLNANETSIVVAYLTNNFGSNQENKGKKLFEDLCSSCHELARVRDLALSREQWRQLVNSMLVEGDAATDEEKALIAEYLVKTFGTKQP